MKIEGNSIVEVGRVDSPLFVTNNLKDVYNYREHNVYIIFKDCLYYRGIFIKKMNECNFNFGISDHEEPRIDILF